MPEQTSRLKPLLARVRAGDDDAAQEVVDTYAPIIFREVRRRLHQPLLSLFDPTDILQEVWKDFFSKRAHRQVFRAEVQLIRYLSGMARRIILELERRH